MKSWGKRGWTDKPVIRSDDPQSIDLVPMAPSIPKRSNTESAVMSDHKQLGPALLRSEAFPHPVESLQLLETHISWVVLTGRFAYKIKKPVRFPFVDYSTLSLRKHYCHEELRLNSRLAPDIYLNVVPIMSCVGKLSVGGDGELVDCAVRMREFPQTSIFAAQLADGRVSPEHIDDLGRLLAGFHQSAEVATNSARISADHLYEQTYDNVEYLSKFFSHGTRKALLEETADWVRNRFGQLIPVFQKRISNGFIRHCHGDMHLENIIIFNDKVQVFDCIEFNPELQWIDCTNDLAFPVMDLLAHDRPDLAYRLLSVYLEQTGDYAGLEPFDFFQVYRALVRAKVSLMRDESSAVAKGKSEKYLNVAANFTKRIPPRLWITYGVAGSGKSTAAMRLVESLGAVRIRSDVERNRLFGDLPTDKKYSATSTQAVYHHLATLTETAIGSGYSVVVDATFLKREFREMFAEIARRLQLRFGIVECEANPATLRQRVASRTADASEATVEIIDAQLKSRDPLTADEISVTVKA